MKPLNLKRFWQRLRQFFSSNLLEHPSGTGMLGRIFHWSAEEPSAPKRDQTR